MKAFLVITEFALPHKLLVSLISTLTLPSIKLTLSTLPM